MRTFLPVLLLLISYSSFGQSIYKLKTKCIHSGEFDFANFQQRVILIVNVASSSLQAKQLHELQELHDRYRDSGLVVIVFPSDDFDKEKKSADEIKGFYKNYSFLVADKVKLKGEGVDDLFAWLGDKKKNGVTEAEPKADFEKYIISREGLLVAHFSQDISPLDPALIEIIRKN